MYYGFGVFTDRFVFFETFSVHIILGTDVRFSFVLVNFM